MGMTPQEIYGYVDRKLRDRWTMREKAEAAVRRAIEDANRSRSTIGGVPGGKGGRKSNPTQKAALILAAAEKQRDDALKWEEVFRKLDTMFPEKSNEGFIAGLIYGNGMSQQDVCRFCKISRQTVRRRIDRYVNYAALVAAGYGLIPKSEKEEVL